MANVSQQNGNGSISKGADGVSIRKRPTNLPKSSDNLYSNQGGSMPLPKELLEITGFTETDFLRVNSGGDMEGVNVTEVGYMDAVCLQRQIVMDGQPFEPIDAQNVMLMRAILRSSRNDDRAKLYAGAVSVARQESLLGNIKSGIGAFASRAMEAVRGVPGEKEMK